MALLLYDTHLWNVNYEWNASGCNVINTQLCFASITHVDIVIAKAYCGMRSPGYHTDVWLQRFIAQKTRPSPKQFATYIRAPEHRDFRQVFQRSFVQCLTTCCEANVGSAVYGRFMGGDSPNYWAIPMCCVGSDDHGIAPFLGCGNVQQCCRLEWLS